MTFITMVSRVEVIRPDLHIPPVIELVNPIYGIGRQPPAEIVVPYYYVSRRHGWIERDDQRYLLVDNGSRNGTFVNGQLLRGPHVLNHDDYIGLGEPAPVLRFVDPEVTVRPGHRLFFDPITKSFSIGITTLQLQPAQFRLLSFLYQHAGSLCTREECAQALWGRPYNPDIDQRAFDQAMSSLRRAIRAANPNIDPIEAQRGRGYTLKL
jgi:hypothetical protein